MTEKEKDARIQEQEFMIDALISTHKSQERLIITLMGSQDYYIKRILELQPELNK